SPPWTESRAATEASWGTPRGTALTSEQARELLRGELDVQGAQVGVELVEVARADDRDEEGGCPRGTLTYSDHRYLGGRRAGLLGDGQDGVDDGRLLFGALGVDDRLEIGQPSPALRRYSSVSRVADPEKPGEPLALLFDGATARGTALNDNRTGACARSIAELVVDAALAGAGPPS
ncbi:hypothetical protein ACFWWC_46405, partial [Streptomyces sp. NPDC058642]|uniref:hypothetical protein n=1 Tax=Streptomyces sp. NPDC058642 TaxID=3346572 RepID=UPI00366072D2